MGRTNLLAVLLLLSLARSTQAAEPSPYAKRAREVTEHIQKTFFDPQSGVYFKSVTVRKPDYVWLQSVMFSNLVAAARSEPATYGPLLQKYFTALDGYWDAKVKIPGYEPAPTRGNGNDKYYDDNAWLVITFLEAYETNRDPRYLTRAERDAQIRAERLGRGGRRGHLVASRTQGRHQERLLQRAGGGGLPAAGEVPRGTDAAALIGSPARSSRGR